MSTKSKLALFSIIIAVAISISAIAAPVNQQTQDQSNNRNTEIQNQFIALDRNKDGQISRLESYRSVAIPGHFHRLDTNRNRLLDKGEFAQFEYLVPRSLEPVNKPQDSTPGSVGTSDSYQSPTR